MPGRTPIQDVNFADVGGWTPLHKAAKAGRGEVVEVLLQCGALPDTATKLGETALIKAAKYGHEEALSSLLRWKASPGLAASVGYTALHWAAANNHTACTRCLLEGGANEKAKSSNGDSPLQVACRNGHNSVENILLGREPPITVVVQAPLGFAFECRLQPDASLESAIQEVKAQWRSLLQPAEEAQAPQEDELSLYLGVDELTGRKMVAEGKPWEGKQTVAEVWLVHPGTPRTLPCRAYCIENPPGHSHLG